MSGQQTQGQGQEEADIHSIEGQIKEVVAILFHQRTCLRRILIQIKNHMDQLHQGESFVVMGIGRKTDPGNQSGKRTGQNPRQIERSIPRVKQTVAIVIVASGFTIAAILRTFLFVFIPAGFMHDMLAFDNNRVSLDKRSLTEIAGLIDQYPIVSHIFIGVLGDILAFENDVSDSR